MGVVDPLRVGLSEGQAVGGGAIRVAEENRVVVYFHTVKAESSPLVINSDSKVAIPLTASYVRVLSQHSGRERKRVRMREYAGRCGLLSKHSFTAPSTLGEY